MASIAAGLSPPDVAAQPPPSCTASFPPLQNAVATEMLKQVEEKLAVIRADMQARCRYLRRRGGQLGMLDEATWASAALQGMM